MWKFQKFSLTEKIFREINSLVTYLVKPLVSRNFCQKSVRENFRNFHIVLSHNMKKFRVINSLQEKVDFTNFSLKSHKRNSVNETDTNLYYFLSNHTYYQHAFYLFFFDCEIHLASHTIHYVNILPSKLTRLFFANMTEDFSLKALVLHTMRLSAIANY